jgi:hypothetical protein
MTSHQVQNAILLAAPVSTNAHANLSTQLAFFTHTVQTKGNSIHFAHQSHCSPKISTLLKAIWQGYLKGCPNLTVKGVLKYLNPSPATAKRHMKCPCQGIQSTQPKGSCTTATYVTTAKLPIIANVHDDDADLSHFAPQGGYPHSNANVLDENNSSTRDANLFCFAAFADKWIGTLYNDLTSAFPFVLLERNVWFLIVYHYESNAILALPFLGFRYNVIFAAYKQQYKLLESKDFVIKFNVMDNQARNIIKQYLTPKQCDLMLFEPNYHQLYQVNPVKRAIQMFKDHFVSALATTNSKFPLQLWDRLTPHVKTLLNMLRPLRIDPTKSAYEVLNGPYNWNQFPLHRLAAKRWFMKPPSHLPWGAAGVLTRGTLAHLSITTGAITISCRKRLQMCYFSGQHYLPTEIQTL